MRAVVAGAACGLLTAAIATSGSGQGHQPVRPGSVDRAETRVLDVTTDAVGGGRQEHVGPTRTPSSGGATDEVPVGGRARPGLAPSAGRQVSHGPASTPAQVAGQRAPARSGSTDRVAEGTGPSRPDREARTTSTQGSEDVPVLDPRPQEHRPDPSQTGPVDRPGPRGPVLDADAGPAPVVPQPPQVTDVAGTPVAAPGPAADDAAAPVLTATELPVPWIDVPPPARIAGDDRPPAAAVEDPGPGPHDVRPATSAAVPAAPVEPASPAPAAVEATATITTPVDGVATPRSVTVSGTAALPAGRRLWLLVRAPDGAHHTTTQRPIRIALTGEWTVPVTLGRGPQDVGRSYGLVLVVAPDGGAVQTAVDGRPEGRSSARLLAVPDDTVVMQRILVTSTT